MWEGHSRAHRGRKRLLPRPGWVPQSSEGERIRQLDLYLLHHGERGPVEGWPIRKRAVAFIVVVETAAAMTWNPATFDPRVAVADAVGAALSDHYPCATIEFVGGPAAIPTNTGDYDVRPSVASYDMNQGRGTVRCDPSLDPLVRCPM